MILISKIKHSYYRQSEQLLQTFFDNSFIDANCFYQLNHFYLKDLKINFFQTHKWVTVNTINDQRSFLITNLWLFINENLFYSCNLEMTVTIKLFLQELIKNFSFVN